MRRLTLVHAGTLALAVLMAGCMSPRNCCQSPGRREQGVSPAGELVNSHPLPPSPDTAALASYEAPANGGLSDSGEYRVLKPHDAQCAAAAHSPKANALWHESRIVASQGHKHFACRQSGSVLAKAMEYRAADERNHAAAQALEAFYLLAEAEADRGVLARSKTQIDTILEEVRNIHSSGIRVEKGGAEFERLQLDLRERQAELRLVLAQSNSGLRQLMGLSFEESTPIWPEADWKVTVEAIDVNAAVSDGLYRRADLNLLRMLIQCLDSDSIEDVGSSLALIIGATGTPSAAHCLHSRKAGDEASSRRRQLNDLLAYQELAAAEEIRRAALTVEIRLQQIAVAKSKVDHLADQLQVQRLSRERPGSAATAFDVAAAELKLLDAQRELIHQVMAWRIAQAKLKESQGLLVFECSDGR
jgi:hypothetical protein